jgi:hypothetical protein
MVEQRGVAQAHSKYPFVRQSCEAAPLLNLWGNAHIVNGYHWAASEQSLDELMPEG